MMETADLGIIGMNFLRERLLTAGALSRALCQIDFEACFTVGGPSLKRGSLIEFEGSPGTCMSDSLAWIQQSANRLGSGSATYSFVLEDPWLIPSDVTGENGEEPGLAVVENTVTYSLDRIGLAKKPLKEFARVISSFEFSGVVVTRDIYAVNNRLYDPKSEITSFESIVTSVTAVFVSAYDRDGLVIATPHTIRS